jgi:hypothetical protein
VVKRQVDEIQALAKANVFGDWTEMVRVIDSIDKIEKDAAVSEDAAVSKGMLDVLQARVKEWGINPAAIKRRLGEIERFDDALAIQDYAFGDVSLLSQGRKLSDRLPTPYDDYWGVSPAWDVNANWFAIYEFVTPDSKRFLGCLEAHMSDLCGFLHNRGERNLGRLLRKGDRFSVLCDPGCPDRHVVYHLIDGLKIGQGAARK